MKINIIPYKAEHKQIFKDLNLEWLDYYRLTESHDLEILDDPGGKVIDKGGYIWLAEAGDAIVGSAGLMKYGEAEYELIKMAVAEKYRGRGIGKMLIETCLQKAKEIGAVKVSLYSNHQLSTAISLYEKYGFYHVELVNSPLETADVRMELIL